MRIFFCLIHHHQTVMRQLMMQLREGATPVDSPRGIDLEAVIRRIQTAKADDPHFDAYVHVMGEYVKHHVEEEEDEMFSELRKENPDMKDVLKKMKAFKAAA